MDVRVADVTSKRRTLTATTLAQMRVDDCTPTLKFLTGTHVSGYDEFQAFSAGLDFFSAARDKRHGVKWYRVD